MLRAKERQQSWQPPLAASTYSEKQGKLRTRQTTLADGSADAAGPELSMEPGF